MPFSDSDYNQLLNYKGNKILKKRPEEKYAQYKANDPFPEIGDALLNSVDIVKYCMTTGMIDPFEISEVKGVTYTCHFSGKYYYWEGNSINPDKKTEADNPELILRPNSITYLEIDEIFRVPDYLIIRYNLQVTHVYKGLLLGTGPIVDPGFVGRLYIPLHNLTSNEYRIKKGAPLITLEFTKVGRNGTSTSQNAWPKAEKSTLNFTAIHHQPENIKAGRDFDFYLRKALIGSDLFRKTKDNICVGSSIPEKFESAEASAKSAEASAKNSEKLLATTRNILFGIGIIGFITIVIGIWAIINDVNGRVDSVLSDNIAIVVEIKQLEKEKSRLLKENAILLDENAALRAKIDALMADEAEVGTEGSPE